MRVITIVRQQQTRPGAPEGLPLMQLCAILDNIFHSVKTDYWGKYLPQWLDGETPPVHVAVGDDHHVRVQVEYLCQCGAVYSAPVTF